MRRLIWHLINVVQAFYTLLWSALWIVAALVVRLITGDNRIPLAMARRCWAPGLLAGGFMRVEVTGLDNLDRDRPHFFAANHQSIVDVVGLFYALPVPLLFMLKKELLSVPFLGWYVSAMGMITLERHKRRSALENLSQCHRHLTEGKSIITFPEGTRSLDGTVGPFKPGTFIPAIDDQIPIVPIALEGPGKILPPGGFRVRPGTIRIAIGPPIPTTGLALPDRRDLARRVRDRVVDLRRGLVDGGTRGSA